MIVLYISTSIGVMLINIGTTTEAHLYILSSLLISLALIPILLTKKPAPEFTTPKFLSLKDLYKKSPMAFVASFSIGMVYSALFGLIAVFGAKIGFSIFQISILVFVNMFIDYEFLFLFYCVCFSICLSVYGYVCMCFMIYGDVYIFLHV